MNTNLTSAPVVQLRLMLFSVLAALPAFAGAPLDVSISASSSTITLGQPVTFTANLSLVQSGTVLFSDGSVPLGYGTLSGQVATYTTHSLPAGVRSVVAQYGARFSAPVAVTVLAFPGTALTAQPVISGFAQSYTSIVADVNNDGYPDIITVDSGYGSVGVSLGSAGGQFSNPIFFGAGVNGWNAVALDFNQDGKLDLAVMSDDGNVEILIGNGDGTFQGPVPYLVSSTDETVWVSAGDFNGDGIMDLLVTSVTSLYVLLGNGDGTFTLQPAPIVLGFTGNMTAVADFNHDNIPDLAVQDYDTTRTTIYRGVGDGTFTFVGTIGTSQSDNSASGVITADFNNDGNIDVASAGNITTISLGDGLGNFAAVSGTVSTANALSIATGDLNGDGTLDLVIGDGYFNAVDVFYGDGMGNFGNVYFASTPTDDLYLYPYSIAIGDFNGDGVSDLVAAGDDGDIAVYFGIGVTAFGLTITDNGPFTQGQSGAQFTVTATNTSGSVYESSGVTIASTLSTGLSAASIAGTGWTCVLGSLTCTRSDQLASGVSYPPVIIVATVAGSASNSVTASAVLTIPPNDFGFVTRAAASVHSSRSAPSAETRGTNGKTPKSSAGPIPGPDPPDLFAASDTVAILLAVPLTPQTITFGPLADGIYTDAPYTVSATSSSGLPITFSISGNCQLNGTAITMFSPGACTVTAYQAGNGTYAAAVPVVQVLQVEPPVITVSTTPTSAQLGQSVTLTANVNALTATGKVLFFDGSTPLDYATVSGGVATLVTKLLPAGNRAIDANFVGFTPNGPAEIEVQPAVANALGVQPAVTGFTVAAGVFTADLNNDGYADVVVFDATGFAWVSLGTAGGGFSTPVSYPLGEPTAMNLADVNNDGILDIVFVGAGTLLERVGNSDGTFQNAVALDNSVGTNARGVVPVDIDGDGNVDLVVIDDNGIEIFFGTGMGPFNGPDGVTLGFAAGAVQVADFNSDGVPDIIVQNAATGDAAVYLNNDDGSFSGPGPLAAAPGALSGIGLAINDFNNDGNVDVAVGGSGATQIYISNGNGTFLTGSVVADSVAATIASGDFNGDTELDLVFGNATSKALDVFWGNGSGNFVYEYSGAPSSDTSSSPVSLAIADFNGDGRTDVVAVGGVTTFTPYFSLLAPAVQLTKSHAGYFVQGQTGATYSLVLQDVSGGNTFGPITVTDTLPSGLTATAISGNGWTCSPLPATACTRSDVLTVGSSYPAIALTVSVASDAPSSVTNNATVSGALAGGSGTTAQDVTTIQPLGTLYYQSISFGSIPNHAINGGTFTLTASASSGLPVTFTATGNCTVSGSTVTVTGLGSCTITANQAGNGTYAAAIPISQTFTVAPGLVLTTSAGPSRLGQTVTLTAAATPSSATGLVLFLDSGTPLGYGTLASGVATFTTNQLPAGRTFVSANSGGGSSNVVPFTVNPLADTQLAIQPPLSGFEIAGNTVSGDLNNDGYIDLATSDLGANAVGISLGSAGGQFGPVTFYAEPAATFAIALADVDGDGKLDLIATDDEGLGNVYVSLGNGDGTFQPVITSFIGASYTGQLIAGDFNGDGKIDFLAPNGSGVAVLLGNGDGTFTAGTPIVLEGYLYFLGVADFNADGKTDFAGLDESAIEHVLLGNGDGTFTAGVQLGTSQFESAFGSVVGDFNNDGKPDIAVGAANTVLYLGNGDGTFTAAGTVTPVNSTTSMNLGDFNGDGNLDLILWDDNALVLNVYLGNGLGAFTAGFSTPPLGPPVSEEFYNELFVIADLNLDGLSDVVLNGFDPYIAIYLGTPATGLLISETDSGSLTAGEAGSLSFAVTNSSVALSTGTVTVVDTLPAGVTATSISGAGWTCMLSTLTCTRSDTLAAGASYPPITIGVSVAADASGTLTNTFSVSATIGGASGTKSLVILPAGSMSQTISFAQLPGSVFGSTPIELTATASSGLPVTFVAAGNCTVSGSVLTITGAGSCTVTAEQAGGGGYAPAVPVAVNFAIAKASATVTLGPLTQAPVTATTLPPGLPVIVTYNGSTTVPTAPGTYTVVATVNNLNYQGSATGTLTITAGVGPTITWNPAPLAAGAPLGPAQLDAASNVAGTFTYSPAAGTILPAGANTLTVIFTPASGPAVTDTVVIQVGLSTQTITFVPIGNHLSTDEPFALSATSSSGLPVVFTILSGPATISGVTLTFTGTGTIVVQASVAANADFSAVTVNQTFTVTSPTALTLAAFVNSASYDVGTLSAGYIATMFGTNMSTSTAGATTTPLPPTLGGTTISIVDSSGQTLTALLFYVSPGQINFLVPDNAQEGAGTLTLTVAGQSSSLPVQIAATDPGLYAADSTGSGTAAGNALHLTTAGVFTYEPLTNCSGTPVVCAPNPIQFETPGEQVFLVLYGTGFRGRTSLANVAVSLGGTALPVLYAGPQLQYDGLDQLNVEIPASMAGSGQITVQVTVDGEAANPLTVTIQ